MRQKLKFLVLAIAAFLFTLVVLSGLGSKPSPASDTSSNYMAVLGDYDVGTYGFSFENYGNDGEPVNLTANDLQRLFGPQVCASKAGGNCILTPPAEEWMEQINEAMGGGHCEGMAALSLLFYLKELDPEKFGGNVPSDLKLADNEQLQREIAYWFSTQFISPTSDSETKITPNEVLDALIDSFSGKTNETYTIGIYKPTNPAGGHAITPWAIEDKGNDIFAIKVYDNNYPGVDREVLIDRKANTWSYTASTNPSEEASEYTGDAETKTLTLAPTSIRMQPQICPFCEETTVASANKADSQEYNEIWLDGTGDLLITDAQGRKYGYINGKLVQQIPGVTSNHVKSADLWKEDTEPVYYVPTGIQFQLTLDGSKVRKAEPASVIMIGPGYDLGVEEITLSPNQKDTIAFSSDGTQVSYTTQGSESPIISLGFEGKTADYEFALKGVDLDGGGTINVKLELGQEALNLDTQGNQKPGTYAILMNRIDDNGEQTFYHDDLTLNPKDRVSLAYGKWNGEGGTIPLQIDRGGDGTIDETLTLSDDQA